MHADMRYVCRRPAHCYQARTTPSKTNLPGNSYGSGRRSVTSGIPSVRGKRIVKRLLVIHRSRRLAACHPRRHSTDSVALHELRAALIISRVQSRSAGREQVHHTCIYAVKHTLCCPAHHAATCWGHRLYIHVHHASSSIQGRTQH